VFAIRSESFIRFVPWIDLLIPSHGVAATCEILARSLVAELPGLIFFAVLRERHGRARTQNAHDALDLPACCQVGFVVDDLEAAIARYELLFGPFEIVEYGRIEGALFRGESSPYEIRIGVGYTGDLELELIEWVSSRTPHKEFLDAGRTGMHHLSFTVPDLDAVVERGRALGYQPIWYHAMSDEIKYAYLERDGDPLLIELTQRPWSGGNLARADQDSS
jgi:methylmalonyl-CoA/ethylmalonyl-CoA epimerase